MKRKRNADESLRASERSGATGIRAVMTYARSHAPWLKQSGLEAGFRSAQRDPPDTVFLGARHELEIKPTVEGLYVSFKQPGTLRVLRTILVPWTDTEFQRNPMKKRKGKKKTKARKKPRSAKQRAATKRMLAARWKKHPRRATKKRHGAKRKGNPSCYYCGHPLRAGQDLCPKCYAGQVDMSNPSAKHRRAAKTAREWISWKIRKLIKEGYAQKRAIAAALTMARKKGLAVSKKNPILGVLTGNPKRGKKGNPHRKAKKHSSRGRSARHECKGKAKCGAKRSNPTGRLIRWKDLSPSMKADPAARKAASFAARLAGIPLDEVVGEFCDAPSGTSKHVPIVGELESISYKAQPRSRRAFTQDGRRIVWDHKAGDHGRGKVKTAAQLVVRDMRTGKPILVSRRGSRAGVSSRRGLLG